MTRPSCRICGVPTAPGHTTHGRCGACAIYQRRHGTERPTAPALRCAICGWPHYAHGLCRAHYMAAWRRGQVGQRYRPQEGVA